MNGHKKIKVLIVDDSQSIRRSLTMILEEDPRISVIGTAADPYEAAKQIAVVVPDVITLDLEMPRMNGLTFLKKLMNQHPIPVVIVSSFTAGRRELGIRALALGAAGIVTKPRWDQPEEMRDLGMRLRDAVYAASMQNMTKHRAAREKQADKKEEAAVVHYYNQGSANKLILIGASTGGTELISSILRSLRSDLPPILIVQHMPGDFTGAFANRLNAECSLTVKEAGRNEKLLNGHVYIANGFFHLVVKKVANEYVCDLADGELVNRHRPSVDVLFKSASGLFPERQLMAILLTGMGADGARGLLELKQKGAICIAQDEESCAVYGMPREAVLMDAVNMIGSPGKIVEWMNNFA